MSSVVYGVLRSQVRKMMPGMVRQGMSFRSIARTLRKYGFGYRTTEMLFDWREAEGIWRGEIWSRAAPTGQVFRKGFMTEIDLRFPAKYRVYFDVEKLNPLTGEIEPEVVSMYTDDLLSPEEWIDQYELRDIKDPSDPNKEIISFQLINVRHNIGEPY